jgi:hypothetical protein
MRQRVIRWAVETRRNLSGTEAFVRGDRDCRRNIAHAAVGHACGQGRNANQTTALRVRHLSMIFGILGIDVAVLMRRACIGMCAGVRMLMGLSAVQSMVVIAGKTVRRASGVTERKRSGGRHRAEAIKECEHYCCPQSVGPGQTCQHSDYTIRSRRAAGTQPFAGRNVAFIRTRNTMARQVIGKPCPRLP